MIIERLKSFFDDDTTLNQREIIIDRAIDHIEALRAENARLTEREKILSKDNIHRSEKIIEFEAENARLQQVSALTCDKCGWAMQFPGEECRNCGYEALRAENARLREIMAEETKDSLAFIRKQADEIARLRKALEPFAHLEPEYTDDDGNGEFIIHRDDLRAARAAMGEVE